MEIRVSIGDTDVTEDVNLKAGIALTSWGRQYELESESCGRLTFQLRPGAFATDYLRAHVRYELDGETKYEGRIQAADISWPDGGATITAQGDDG